MSNTYQIEFTGGAYSVFDVMEAITEEPTVLTDNNGITFGETQIGAFDTTGLLTASIDIISEKEITEEVITQLKNQFAGIQFNIRSKE